MITGMLPMAKKPPGKPPGKPDPKEVIQWGVKMTREYQDWLGALASFDRCTMAGLFDRAVASYAKQIGFNGRPPERVP